MNDETIGRDRIRTICKMERGPKGDMSERGRERGCKTRKEPERENTEGPYYTPQSGSETLT